MSDLISGIEKLSPAKRALLLQRLRAKEGIDPSLHIKQQQREAGGMPLSFAQERLWFQVQLGPEIPFYTLAAAFVLKGELHVRALEQSLQELIHRHETLRTFFTLLHEQPVQVIVPVLSLPFPVVDLSNLPSAQHQQLVQHLAHQQAAHPFNLSQPPLFRASLLCLQRQEYVLILSLHHIICDGWSLDVLFRELNDCYAAFCAGQPAQLAALPIQYLDYALWQREQFVGPFLQKQLAYWQQQLASLPPLELPTDRPRPTIQRFRGRYLRFALPDELAECLRQVSQREEVTLFMTLLAALQIVLARYCQQEDIAIGTPVANRTRRELEGLIGFFVNTLVMRTDLSGDPTVQELLSRTREVALGAYAHQDLPFEQLVKELNPARRPGQHPFFQIMFALQNTSNIPLTLDRIEAQPLRLEYTTTQFDFTLNLYEEANRLTGGVEYDSDLFDATTIERFLTHYQRILEGMVADPTQRISHLSLLTEAERKQLLDWSTTINTDLRIEGFQTIDDLAHVTEAQELSLVELFAAQVERTPDAVAIVYEQEQLTYQDLNVRANQLAHALRDLNISPEVIVGLYFERSLAQLIGMLAIVKAGGVYLPLDVSSPIDHLTSILQDSQVAAILTHSRWQEQLRPYQGTILCLDRLAAQLTRQPVTNPAIHPSPQNLAYIIYTSGSTGKPKGVQITYRSLINHCRAIARQYNLEPVDRVVQFASFSFDAAVEEIYPTWLSGAALILRQQDLSISAEDWQRWLEEQKISVLNLPTAYWHHWVTDLVQHPATIAMPSCLRLVIVGGEQARSDYYVQWEHFAGPGIQWSNTYGPTESTVTATLYAPAAEVIAQHVQNGKLPIGRPLANISPYILDRHLQPVPIGIAGELYLGGAGLARGYLHHPALTAERFIPSPYAQTPGERLYRTGDLVRYLPDGYIEYVGRNDQQIKIRGYRIEPGEIEEVLRHCPDVQEAVVATQETPSGDRFLVAYLVATHTSFSLDDARLFLQTKLPAYMLPSAFLLLDSLLLTATGKIDRRALPRLESVPEATYVAARTTSEEVLVTIWQEILERERIGVYDNFFELGGHSLLATQLISRVCKAFQIDLPLHKLFEVPTIAGLAQAIAYYQGTQDSYEHAVALLPTIEPDLDRRHEPFPLTDVLQAYWIGQNEAFEMGNVAAHGYLEVQKSGLDLERFTLAWNRLVARHDMLRAIILADGQQQILAGVPFYQVRIMDMRGRDSQAIETHLQTVRQQMSHQILPTDSWPQFEVMATLLDEERVLLHMSVGPSTGDAASWHIVDHDLAILYKDPNASLPPLTLSFRDYVLATISLQDTALYRRSQEYWQQRLHTLPPAPDLPLAQSPAALTHPRFVRRTLTLAPEAWKTLKARAARRGLTPSGVILAAFAEVLARWSKSPRFTINMTVFNRLPFHPQVNDLVGDFTGLCLLATDLSVPGTFSERARRVQQQMWQDLDHRYVSGIQVLRNLARIQGNNLSARMPIVFTSTLTQPVSGDHDRFLSSDLSYSLTQTPQVWIDSQATEQQGAFVANWDAVEDLFPIGMLDAMFDAYHRLLQSLSSEERLWQEQSLPLLPVAQVELQKSMNITDGPISTELLHTLFIARVAQCRELPSVIAPLRTLTYEELYNGASWLGRRLRLSGARPNTLVAVVMEKGWEQIVAVLGILFSGAAYLPIDAGLPQERVWHLLEHGEVSITLTQSWLEEQLSWPDHIQRISVDTETLFEVDHEQLAAVQQPEDLAYVIYTSGSTGQPKGVMGTHAGAVNTVLDVNRRLAVQPSDRVLAVSSLSFDLSVYDTFGTLAAGATIVMPGASARRDPAHWLDLLVREKVTVWNSVPALLEMLIEYVNNLSGTLPMSLRLILLSGDWIPVTLPGQIRALLPDVQIVSQGGPTETSIWSIFYPIQQIDPAWKSIPYGRPMTNQHVYVLNDLLEPCPIWTPGELYIGGMGLAKGYWRDDSRTQASFINHPRTHERLYRSGDLGRYLPDGNIEILGREDFQVKIQGHRIELGEIEFALLQVAGVRAAVVAATSESQGYKRLVAYVVSDQDLLPVDTLRRIMQMKLPDYMIPSAFVQLETLPLTANGKVDRKALPTLNPPSQEPVQGTLVEKSAMAARIAVLVARILRLDSIDANANLLDLGASSIDIVRILNLLEKELHFRPPMADFFGSPSVEWLARAYEKHTMQAGKAEPASETMTAHSAFELLLDPDEQAAFKLQQPGLRQIDKDHSAIPLVQPREDLRSLYLARRSQRKFMKQAIPFAQFSAFLGCLRQISIDDAPKYRYPSAGGLYPVQVYLHLKANRVENLSAGIYYYHPVQHQLVLLAANIELDRNIHEPFVNRPTFDEAAFSLFLIAQLSAIAPIYGNAAEEFSLLEAGYMSQLLMESASVNQIGLCPIGGLYFERIRTLFALDDGHILVHSLVGGKAYPDGGGRPGLTLEARNDLAEREEGEL